MHAALEQLYDNNAVQYKLSDDTKFDDDFFDKVADEIFQMGGYSPDYLTTPNGSALIEETSRIFDNAINAGIGYEPDPELQSALSQNAFVFSGFKIDKELQEVATMLTKENGDIVPFDEFKQKVLAINQKYNVNYLQAEYNFAVQSAQMASKWQEFEKHKDFVNLQYRTAGDERVREEHRALDKTTLPVDDPFWKEYLPPLGWNCRCTVVEVLKDLQPVSNSAQAIKAGQMATSKPAQKIFRFNPGQTQKLFPPKHPYLPQGEKCKNCNLGDKINLAFTPQNRECQICNKCRILFDKKNTRRLSPVEKRNVRIATIDNFKKHVPLVTYGNDTFHEHKIPIDGLFLKVRKTFFDETISKNLNRNHFAKLMNYLTEYENWVGEGRFVRIERGRHHDCEFIVYEVEWDNEIIEYKAMVLPYGNILYIAKIKRQ